MAKVRRRAISAGKAGVFEDVSVMGRDIGQVGSGRNYLGAAPHMPTRPGGFDANCMINRFFYLAGQWLLGTYDLGGSLGMLMTGNLGKILTGIGSLVLAACGGAGIPDDERPQSPAKSYVEYQAQAVALHSQWDLAGATDPSTLPFGGSAHYDGVVELRFQTSAGDLFMDGGLHLDVDFAANQISGNAGSFVQQDENPVSGSLAISGGVIDRGANPAVEYTYSAIIAGTLTTSTDSFVVGGDIHGDFLGAAQQSVAGIVAGNAQSNMGVGYVFGDFIAEQ